jgi:hypothetical protein
MGGTGEGGREHPASTEILPETPLLTNAELVQLHLLAETSDRQPDPARSYSLRFNAFPEWTTIARSPG